MTPEGVSIRQLDEVDAPQTLLVGAREVKEGLEVVDRQPARPEDLGVELPAQDAVRPHQAGERVELDWSWALVT